MELGASLGAMAVGAGVGRFVHINEIVSDCAVFDHLVVAISHIDSLIPRNRQGDSR